MSRLRGILLTTSVIGGPTVRSSSAASATSDAVAGCASETSTIWSAAAWAARAAGSCRPVPQSSTSTPTIDCSRVITRR